MGKYDLRKDNYLFLRLKMSSSKIQAKDDNISYPTALSYKQYEQRMHVYMKPDMYIGADQKMVRNDWLFDLVNKKMVNATIDFTPGCERLFLEILTNASDNVGRSRRAGVDPGKLEILMTNSTISITNYGLPIPIEIHPEENIYIPQMIFGSLLTSSNYEVERHEAGTNGIGAKAANIFSTEFMVIVHDHIRHLKYTQVWNTNMTVRGEPIIEQYTGKVSSVQIVYVMDFARFGYPIPNDTEGGYPSEAFALFARHAVDISFTAKTQVSFNGHEFNYSNIRDYARLYFGDAVDNAIVHYQWPPNTEIVKKKKGYQIAKNPAIIPEVELIALDTPDEGHHISLVNSMTTPEGGVHVNAGFKAIADNTVKMINEEIMKKLMGKKNKEVDAKEKKAHTINIGDVKPHISILLSVRVKDPKFTSQTKTQLHSPTPKITIDPEDLRIIQKWKLIPRLYATLEAKQFASLSKTDGKLKKYVRLQKGIDANNAGKALRHQCVLYITEGQSGAGYANTLVDLVPGGRDNIGTLPMRGKSLNVMNATPLQIERNSEINELKNMLGLVDCPDPKQLNTYYLDDNNFSKLRYGGGIMIMADSDVDGKHIVGLILNFFYCRFPSLLARGYVVHYRTPIIRVTNKRTKEVKKFYMEQTFDNWLQQDPSHQDKKIWKPFYYKGLGTSSDADVADDYQTRRIISCFYDPQAPVAMRLAFDKRFANQRKDWIGRWRNVLQIEDVVKQPISDFINHELILFSIEDTKRSLPRLMDGFKESHRKIIYGAHECFNIGGDKMEKQKVAQFSAKVAEVSKYHHGELILDDVIVKMSHDFVGSNNIPWFTRESQAGSLFEGGKDAAASRYLYTKPENIVQYILRKEDRPLLKHRKDENKEIEPETYLPVIPMVLVNGSSGIGTGYSTFIPNHNPMDIIKWLRLKLSGAPDSELFFVLPWYKDFEGTIKVIDRRTKKRNGPTVNITIVNQDQTVVQTVGDDEPTNTQDENLEGVDDEDMSENNQEQDDDRPLFSVVTMGNFSHNNNGMITVTSLPIGRWIKSYHKWLELMVEKKKITGFRNRGGKNRVLFEIDGFQGDINHRTLKLIKTMGMSNMYLLDDDDRPVRYNTSFEILDAFYIRRLRFYEQRKAYYIQKLIDDKLYLQHKIRFIQAVRNKEINLIDAEIDHIYATMDQLQIPHDIYDKAQVRILSKNDIDSLLKKITDKETEQAQLEAITPQQLWLNDLQDFENAYLRMLSANKKATNDTKPKHQKSKIILKS